MKIYECKSCLTTFCEPQPEGCPQCGAMLVYENENFEENIEEEE